MAGATAAIPRAGGAPRERVRAARITCLIDEVGHGNRDVPGRIFRVEPIRAR